MTNDTRYQQLCENLRFTDEISFKLLGLVPFVSGAAFSVALVRGQAFWSPAVFYLSLFGALTILGLFRWELRNIKTCNYLKDLIADLEGSSSTGNKAPGLVWDQLPIGKTLAEKLVYTVCALAWLGLPCAVFGIVRNSADITSDVPVFEAPRYWLWGVVLVGSLLLLSIFSKTKEKREKPNN